jgi:PknH-like extracellular domain
MLHQSFRTDSHLPPWFGGADQLRHAYSDSPSRTDCLGVLTLQEKGTYQSANVEEVAGESWWHDGGSAKVISVTEGVITLTTAADANALFEKFTAQWQQCDGVSVELPGERMSFTDTISDVRVANSVVAATVAVKSNLSGLSSTMPEARAIGVRANCLVEVEIAFYSSPRSSDQGTADVDTSGIDIAHTMMDKVSALS